MILMLLGIQSQNGQKSSLTGQGKRDWEGVGSFTQCDTFELCCYQFVHRLAVVNKGKTADEEFAEIKINSDVDATMCELLKELGIPEPEDYCIQSDPILRLAKPVMDGEPSAPWHIPTTDKGSAGEEHL